MQLQRFVKVLDNFIPEHMRRNPADLMRAYILLGVIFTNVITGFFAAIGLYSLLDLPQQSQYAVGAALATLFVSYGVTLYVFKTTKNYRYAGNTLVFSFTALISLAVCLSGGYRYSPIVQVLAIIPVMGFLLTGLHDGIKWLLIAVVVCAVLYGLSILDRGYVQMIPSIHDLHTMYVGLQIMQILVIGAGLLVYEVINENLKVKLNAERDEFKRRASYDSLTGIPNRFEFFRRLQSGMAECADRGQKLAVIYIDLNGFKPINDQYGHHSGDIVLQEIAKRLQHVLRLSDTAARLGGDEFGLVAPGIHLPDDINMILQKVDKAIEEPINIGAATVSITGSTGVAIFPDNGSDMDLLCRYADSLMYQNKKNGRNAVPRFRN